MNFSLQPGTPEEPPRLCNFWKWEDEYAFYITGDGLTLLLEAAASGGGYAIGRMISETRAYSSSIFYLCVFLIVSQLLQLASGRT